MHFRNQKITITYCCYYATFSCYSTTASCICRNLRIICYNKYLQLQGEVTIEIDYEKFNLDKVWDGLKGYITNTKLRDKQVIENYKNLWHIEKAFRMSKTDLHIRPIYHRLKHRIEAHICISFTAYCIYKELERVVYKEMSSLSLKKAAELTHNMYQITYNVTRIKTYQVTVLKMDDQQY